MRTLLEHGKTGRAFNYAKHVLYLARTIPRLNGMYPRTCNVCGNEGRFLAFGTPPRMDARCPKCGCLERHRLFAFWLQQNAEQVRHSRVLHFAPEAMIRKLLQSQAKDYKGADISSNKADLVLDIEHISLSDNAVDIVVCNHVLEHVNDALALREIHRILTPGGLAILMFPVVEGWRATYENPAITSAADRVLHFGQKDHVRMYGRDVRERITAAGFMLDEFTATEPDVGKYGLLRGETMFIATKPSGA